MRLCDNCNHSTLVHGGNGCMAPMSPTTGSVRCGCPLDYTRKEPRRVENCENSTSGHDQVANPDRTKVADTQVGGDHYRKFKIQVWDIWREYGLDPFRAGAVKYLLRAGHKGSALEDLKKARHYIEKCIEIEQEKEES
ncbi:MAG TPA: DUF3310 domain-containing protein [Acidimicrobiia bacterium]|nr:DUF3310 domain-containing protein [Acidimicrobiia bacterium]